MYYLTLTKLTLLLAATFLISCSSAEEKFIPREKRFEVYRQASEIRSNITDKNRCDSEREISRLLQTVCNDCFDGWGMISYSIDEEQADCVPSKLPRECLEEPRWIARETATCGTCGITYSAFEGPWRAGDVSNMIKPISCEHFYRNLEKKKKFCGNCLKIKKTN